MRAEDYGAYGNLTGTLVHDELPSPDPSTIQIPRDDNNNNIADGWKNDSSEDYDESADPETGPSGNSNNGDGLVTFEEYRGFQVYLNSTHSIHWGKAEPTVGTPTTTYSCIIYWKQMEADANEQEVSASLFWDRAKDTIGHECAHGTHLYDCNAGSGHNPYSNYCYMNDSIWFNYNPYEFNTHHNSEYDHWSQ